MSTPECVRDVLVGYALIGVLVFCFALVLWFAPVVERYQDSYTESGKKYAARGVVKSLVGVPLLTALWPVVFPAWLLMCLWDVLNDAYGKKR